METPKPGEFYYHYKHTDLTIDNYAYRIVGTAVHSETGEIFVIYKPLYEESYTDEKNVDYMARPLSMFTEVLERDGKKFPRFKKIVDEETISKLRASL